MTSIVGGVRECECTSGFEGDGTTRCNPSDECPYPMPGDPGFTFPLTNSLDVHSAQADALHLNTIHVNSLPLYVNDVDSTNSVLMQVKFIY